ncbi:MAG: lyase family protein, partial [Gemmataceae bacterium]
KTELHLAFALAGMAHTLGKLAMDVCLYNSQNFRFLRLPDELTTGSSIMPHKKNPDVLELIRGKTARATSALGQLQMLVKGLPLAYNRDLQEDKLALFDAHDTVSACLELAAALVEETKLNELSIKSRIEDGYLDATTLMEFFIAKGVPMREAHEAVGKLVRSCEESQCRLADLPSEEFEQVWSGIGEEVYGVLGVQNALAAFKSYGSTAPSEVEKQVGEWKNRLLD